MKKKATRRAAKATSRQSTLNFPTSPEADLVAESTAAVTSMKSGMKNRTKRTEDVADKGSESLGDSSAISAIKTPRLRQTHSKSSDPMEQNEIALDKKRSGAELGQEFQNTLINHVAKADGELPRSWTRALLGEMVDIKYGKNLPTSAFTEHGYPVFGANGIIGNYDRYLYNEPQVLISCRGAYSGRINLSPPQCFITNNSLVLEIADSQTVLRDYLYYALQTVDRSKLVTGSAQPQVTINNAEILVIPLAPFPEQHRIVAEIEKQFTRLDAGVAALKRVQANLKRYRAGVLKAACEGKLVPTEASWKQIPLKELIGRISQGWSPKCDVTRDALPDEWAIVTTTAVQSMRYIDNQGKPLPASFTPRPQIEIKVGDFLMTRKGPRKRAGVACLVRATRSRLMVCDTVYRFRCNEDHVEPRYLELALNCPSVVEAIDREKAGINESGVSLTHDKLGGVLIPFPPRNEQTRIVAEVERRLSVVEELEALVSADLLRTLRLRQSILQKVFTGKL